MHTAELRRRYLGFFEERGHKLLPSSSLVPNDPTLMFTSAGMVQFKEIFWGRIAPQYATATTCQKCFRTTDIENVGKTAYHDTFFEMLGNFSFGDYFKEGAIRLAWEFLTEELGIPGERLTAAVFEEDEEAHTIWRDIIGLPGERIVRLGKEHNWWGPVGTSGPCGPDSEIHYDAGEDLACGPDCRGAACDCNRFNEIWNLVFMEYDASEDGKLTPLERRNIDTGMGLERTTAVLQGVPTVFDTDVFRTIVEAVEGAVPRSLSVADRVHRNTIADHVRGVLFLLADGVLPSNERQGYVLRRILRRAIRAAGKLELPTGTLATFIDPVIDTMGAIYPEIVAARDLAHRLFLREEETFLRTLRDGERRLEKLIAELSDSGERTLPGNLAFELSDTYGFPLEMTQEIAADEGVSVDLCGYEQALARQRDRSRAGSDIGTEAVDLGDAAIGIDSPTRFVGYEETQSESPVESIVGSMDGLVVRETPFYAESGGQVADNGRIENLSRDGAARVIDVRRSPVGIFVHRIELESGRFEKGDRCRLLVDVERRRRIERNHTATHLLHRALRDVLGSHATQSGSEVNDRELRFDFSHFERMSPQEIERVENAANAAVLSDLPVTTDEMPLEEAKASGALGLFEEEYRGRDRVRVVRTGDYSAELCGGTHVRRTGEIGLLKIVSEESIAAGVRRIRAITGDSVIDWMRAQDDFAAQVKELLGDDPLHGAERLRVELSRAQDELDALQTDRIANLAGELAAQANRIGEINVLVARADLAADRMKGLADQLESSLRPTVVLLVGDTGGSGMAICKASKGVSSVDAGALVRELAGLLGGGGGGGRGFAQGGGPKVDRIPEALETASCRVREALDTN